MKLWWTYPTRANCCHSWRQSAILESREQCCYCKKLRFKKTSDAEPQMNDYLKAARNIIIVFAILAIVANLI